MNMSKRGAGSNWASGEERYGGPEPGMDNTDKPTHATAAQMARRKIAAAKKPNSVRGRSGSPAVNLQNTFGGGGSIFGGAAPQQPQQQPPAGNPFATNSFDFQFGQQTNGTSSSTPFQFGVSAPAPAQPQQNGMSNPFGQQSSAPSFGNSFSTIASQPQQNGFNPSTSMFSQPTQHSNNTGFGFGQTQSTQQNGTSTPTTNFGGFGSQPQPANTNGNTGFNFGGVAQEKQEPTPANAFASFGQTPAVTNDQPSTPFGNFGHTAIQNGTQASNPFGELGAQTTQQNGDQSSKSLFGFGQERPTENGEQSTNLFRNIGQAKTPEPEKPSTSLFSGGFGQKPAESAPTTSNYFGQKPLDGGDKPSLFATSQAETPKPNTSLFGDLSNTQPAKPSTMFGDASSTQPASTSNELFGSAVMSNEPSKGKSTASLFDNLPPRETPMFGSHIPGQVVTGDDDDDDDEQPMTELFPKSKSLEKVAEAPKPNLFSGFGSTQPTPSTSLFKTSSEQQDTSMTTPSATPQKSLFAPAETPATQSAPRSLLDRINNPAPSSTPAAQPPKSIFERIEQPAGETPKASLFNNPAATPSTTKPLFSQPPSTSETPSLFQKPAASAHLQVPPKNIFSQSAASPSAPAAAPTAREPLYKALPPVKKTFKEPGPNGHRPIAASQSALSDAQRAAFKKLNDMLISQLNNFEPDQDWSDCLRFALVASAEIAGQPRPTESELRPAPSQQQTSTQASTGSGNLFSKPTASSSNTAAPVPAQNILFAQTPKAAPSTNIFSQPPATAPTKKRSFEEDYGESAQQPVTEKRSKPNDPPQYPKLPASASSTAKLFASTLDKSKGPEAPKPSSSSGFNPSTSLFSGSTSASAPSKPASGGFTPSFGAQPASSAPAAGGFTPAAAATGGNSFLSAFGDAAKKQEEKDRKKRKSEDYDSDEETEEQWLKRDQAEQEAKRKKIEEASKSGKGFSLTSANTNGATSPSKQPTAAALEKAQGKGDNTWKPETPIKFNFTGANGTTTSTTPAVSPPKLGGGSLFGNMGGPIASGGLFGPKSTASDASSKLAPPSTGFPFSSQPSSLGVSRATTPGITTDGEASSAAEGDAGDAEGQSDPQAEDQTGLTDDERAANEILAELRDVKTSKNETQEDGKKKWVPKGFGLVYLVKDKESGKTRIISRVGTGKLALNYNPLKGAKYSIHPKKDTMVIASFWDHLHNTIPALGQFIMTASSADDAKELARILTEGTPQ